MCVVSRCLIYKVHALARRSRVQLIYIITSCFVCQHLFSFFFANRSLQRSDPSCFRPKRTCLLYCAVLDLSSTFFFSVIQLLRFIRKKTRSSSELDYYTMPSSNCQVLFRLFLRARSITLHIYNMYDLIETLDHKQCRPAGLRCLNTCG